MFLAYVSPLGTGVWWRVAAVSAQELETWPTFARTGAQGLVLQTGAFPPVLNWGRKDRRNYRSKTELALEMLERVLELGYLRAEWVAGDDAFGMSPTFREGLAALGMRYVLDFGSKTGSLLVWPLDPAWS